MKKLLRIRASIVIFLIFCGVATLEGFRTRNWINVVFWTAIAIMFLVADNLKISKIRSQILKQDTWDTQ
jgi:cell division protein FtsW (lipid II flippase)